jgi:hypothetical protein
VAEFVALGHAGFDPVGQVAGFVVQDLSWWYKSDGPRPNSMAMSDPLMSPERLEGAYKPILDRYVHTLTAARRRAREHARLRLWRNIARVGADGAVLSEANVNVYEKTDSRVAEATYVGTAITSFGSSRKTKRSLTILRL